jgi:hypothetical protein
MEEGEDNEGIEGCEIGNNNDVLIGEFEPGLSNSLLGKQKKPRKQTLDETDFIDLI